MMVPSRKRRHGEKMEEYRGVTIIPTLYKIYAAVLEGRMRKEVEGRGLIPARQTGFRKGTMDNIYVLNYLVNRLLWKKEGKMLAVFVDLRAAFDSLNREELERGRVREGLVERVEEILRETRSRVKVRSMVGRDFWDGEGGEAGMPAEPPAVQLAVGGHGGGDRKGEMRRNKIGRGENFFTNVRG